MNRSSIFAVCALLIATLALASAPDVKYTQTTVTKFHGGMSMLMKMAGGSGPQTSTIMISGNKQRSDYEKNSTIFDLDREVIINIDHKKKEYTEMTFAEWRAMMDKMKNAMAGMRPPTGDKPGAQVDWKFDVKVDNTGEKQTINGYACEKVIMTLKAEGEAKPEAATQEAGGKGGMLVTSTFWLTPKVDGWEESMAFWKSFAEKSGMMGGGAGASAESMMGANPQLAAAFKRMMEESQKLNGVPVKSESVFEGWGQPMPPPGMENQPQGEEKPPKSMGGLLGGLGKKLGKKPDTGGTSESDRKPIFESSSTLESVSNAALEASLFVVPAGYKNKPMKQ